ncbi:MAG: gliding motility lipoprotein GldH [Bacteroidales bacterium]|nr:gliding motility lipoprotein GldH [Bacteroidales bacterium]
MNKIIILLISFLLFFASCKQDVFYEKMDQIDQEVWNVNQKLVYEFEIKDSMAYYDIYFHVRNTTDYPYQNLYFFLTNQFPSGLQMVDTLGCVLCDPFGKWYGKGNGRIKESKFLLRKQVRFQQKGKYVFTVQQGMRDDQLKGISDFGISFEHYNPEKRNP